MKAVSAYSESFSKCLSSKYRRVCSLLTILVSDQMLQDMGFRMDDTQFKELVDTLKFSRHGLNYSDFICGFQDLRTFGVGQVM